jgi:hypothetical protein
MRGDIAYWDTPDDVVWVDLPHRRLQGFDNYWIDGHRYGVWNDPANFAMYDGVQAIAWEDTDGVEVELADPTPPSTATVLRGVLLTAEQASFVGLI